MENEIILIEDKSIIDVAVNYEEAKAWALAQTEKYKNLVVMEDQIPEIKNETANLRKVSKKIDDKRKEIEKNHKLQIEDTLLKLKELKGIFDGAADGLATQTAEFEEKYRNERKSKVQEKIDNIIALEQLEEFASRFAIQEKWINKSTTQKSIDADLALIVTEIRQWQESQEKARKQKEENLEMIKTVYKNKVQIYGFDINKEAHYLSQVDYTTGPAIITMIDTAFEAEKKLRSRQEELLKEQALEEEKKKQLDLETFAKKEEPKVFEDKKEEPVVEQPEKNLKANVKFSFKSSDLPQVKSLMNQLKEIAITWENV